SVVREMKADEADVVHAIYINGKLMDNLLDYNNAEIRYEADGIYAENAFIINVLLIAQVVESMEKHVVKPSVSAMVTVINPAT
ncbi:hypothetical protein FE74_14515, partial [Staphylococcus aureus]